jgi:tRNA threonylcarbamoyl adenosine modification protein (Sua5/YciO/YrdC/YwlC family)
MYLKIHPQNPESRNLDRVVECLKNGGVVIYPTDTVYGIGCDIYNSRAVERIAKIKGLDPRKTNFSFICYDLSHLSDFTKPIDTALYRIMKKALPGPFTFILKANKNVPKLFEGKKKTVGIRVPDNSIIRAVVKHLGNPVLTTSLHSEDQLSGYITDPEIINDKFGNLVDVVIDGGYGNNRPSTIIDCSNGEMKIIRRGIGDVDEIV